MVAYMYAPGDRVYVAGHGEGEVMTCVPGNGTMPWYFVRFDDGIEDRFVADDLNPL